jgi:predicted AlkP superfamily pyrophosphatase or phosphodiesterase
VSDGPRSDAGRLDPTPPAPVAAAAAAPATDGSRARRVLIISEDGLRADVVATLHLPWHEALWTHGSYSWKARTIRTASTLPAHAAMLSGVDVGAHGLTWNNWRPSKGFIKVPTIFDEATEHGLKTAMFVGKSKLRHIATPGTVAVFDRPGYFCKKVAEEAAAYLVAEQPPLAFVHFSDPDEAGHASGWDSEEYMHSVAQSDRCLGTILDALDKAHLTADTLIIVSADHGGHNHTHTGALLIDREIPWIACGPGVRADHRIHAPISTLDTAATALYALGLPIASSVAGKPVLEIYEQPTVAVP